MRILVVDDEASIRFSLSELLTPDGHEVREAEHAPAALNILESWSADLILTDISMPVMSGLQLLGELRARHPDCPVVLLTAHGDERTAVQALKDGAYDYIPKPFDNDEIRALVARTREMLALRTENQRLRAELSREYRGLVGDSDAMREVFRLIRRAGPTDITVLITGESGTGKELVARALHAENARARNAFVALNCSALPADLVESELFGHVRGAFTGADKDREGLFEAARGGTVFLDEIGDLAQPAQAKLLRVLEEREVTRVGANRAIPIDVRVIAATNLPLEQLVADARFREDLLHRLRVVQIHLPPLRERRTDVMALAVHFIAHFAEVHGRAAMSLADDARRALLAHDWPGNIRELRNALERAVVMSEGSEIGVQDLPATVTGTTSALRPTDAALADLPLTEARARANDAFDRAFLAAALERHDGNVSSTARALGIHRQSLQKMLKRLGLERGA